MHIPFAPPGPLCSLAQNTHTPTHHRERQKGSRHFAKKVQSLVGEPRMRLQSYI